MRSIPGISDRISIITSSTSTSSSSSKSKQSLTAFLTSIPHNTPDWMEAFCDYIPMRLSSEERIWLQVLEQTLHVSEYTDHVDVVALGVRRGTKVRRILDGILEATHIATGLVLAASGTNSKLHPLTSNHVTMSTKDEMENDHNQDKNPTTKTTKNKITSKLRGKGKNMKSKRRDQIVSATDISSNSSDTNTTTKQTSPKDHQTFFQTIFEVGRRNKVLNPSSMRSTYGKLMYLLQDAQSPTVAKSLGFSLHKELIMVGPFVCDHGGKALLRDTRLIESTRPIGSSSSSSRQELEFQLTYQKELRQQLIIDYSVPHTSMSSSQVERVLESIRDALTYIESNVQPVRTMLRYLEESFSSLAPESAEFSLQLKGGSRMTSGGSSRYGLSAFATSGSTGPTLSHSHSTQYAFCWQTLKLWIKVQQHMHLLWVCADDDLLSVQTTYHLYNTGQGLQRVQSCPKVAHVMRSLLTQTQNEAKSPWVGLSVIHLGDRDVPNALIFIDKYTQIPRFLSPICSVLRELKQMPLADSTNMETEKDDTSNHYFQSYIQTNFGSPERLSKFILSDYFKYGFDGSGDDGGSCIDGRLTSSWNWTSLLAKKSYYHAFLLSGFQGFDGDFK